MKKIIVTNRKGQDFELTEDEAKFIRAVRRLEKLNPGRLRLFGNGVLSIRIGGYSAYREVEGYNTLCGGGDGGDDFD